MMMMMMMMIALRKVGKCLPIDAALNVPPSCSLMPPVMFSETYATDSSVSVFIHFERVLRLYFHSVFCSFVLLFCFVFAACVCYEGAYYFRISNPSQWDGISSG